MTNKQQIEEMAKDCYYVAHLLRFNDPYMLSVTGWSKLTKEMIKLGWIKPSKDSVVLTRAEYEELKNESAAIAKDYQEMGQFYDEKCEELEKLIQEKHKWTEQTRNETAEKILKWLIDTGVINTAPDTIKMYFKEHFGVEVK